MKADTESECIFEYAHLLKGGASAGRIKHAGRLLSDTSFKALTLCQNHAEKLFRSISNQLIKF